MAIRIINTVTWVAEQALRLLSGFAMAVILVIVGAQIVDRHFFDVPIAAPDAYARIAVVWMTFTGYALAAHANQAIRVDLIDHWLTPTLRRMLAAAFDLLMLATLVLLISKGWLLVELGTMNSIIGTDLTMAVPNTALFVGCIALFIFLAGRSVLRFSGGTD